MEVTLPSGNKVTLRDQFMRGDRREAERALVIVRSPDGSSRMEGSPFSDVAERILRSMIIAWDFGPAPREAQSHLQERMFDNLSDDDFTALQKVVAPWANRIVLGATAGSFTHVPTGVTVIVTSPEAQQKLAAHPDFTSGDEDGPKQIGSPPTATPSSGSPELAGPTTTG